jgi:DNA-binding IclR family transcriptional regulator
MDLKAQDPRRLSDIERKVLRILHAYSVSHKSMPSMKLMQAKTGRKEAGIYEVLKSLADAGYISWEPGQSIYHLQIIRAWEEQRSKWWDKYR